MLVFRSHMVGKLMAYPDKDTLSTGAISAIYEKASQIILGLKPNLDLPAIKKGLACEDEAIELLNLVDDKNYVKNKHRISTPLLTGEWDIYCPEQDLIIDIKNAYSKATFPIVLKDGEKKLYEWQLRAYMLLAGASRAAIVYCLVDTPEELIKRSDPLDWHLVSDIKPEYRITKLEIERCEIKEKQLLNKLKIATKELERILKERNFLQEINF